MIRGEIHSAKRVTKRYSDKLRIEEGGAKARQSETAEKDREGTGKKTVR